MLKFFIILNTFMGISLLYCFLQLYRNIKVYYIRCKWIDRGDDRYDRFTYEEMHLPSNKNWYGLKIPKDKHFK